MKAGNNALTLVEVVIVIAMFAIVSLIVVPELSTASPEIRESALVAGLQSLRGAVREYRDDHGGRLPDAQRLVGQLTMRTDADGNIAPADAEPQDYPYGPYLQAVPENPFVNTRICRDVESGRNGPGGGNAGWYFNVRTGVVYADDDAHVGL
ncbi:MAG: prepilin-type N-terminal cleavage/methylation domain-containing protein [Planctomycetes bacterium]|jgi:general secretion pathway protein G|nr:prepilin-type N-terminal cleavage/methylation domain-containing protein [Phycisphaerae bacterium]NBB95141.1 prepilin-type N-terminal cleavage/methylation domain-containing protein [Planctomycetota bacterium]